MSKGLPKNCSKIVPESLIGQFYLVKIIFGHLTSHYSSQVVVCSLFNTDILRVKCVELRTCIGDAKKNFAEVFSWKKCFIFFIVENMILLWFCKKENDLSVGLRNGCLLC